MEILSVKDFEALVGNVNETSSKKDFSWNEVEKRSDSYVNILNYVKETNVKLVGQGSSRIAFMFPSGSYEKDLSRPICFKVAKNEAGVAQNKAEIDIFSKYKNECFPQLYAWDKKNSFFIETEIGRKLKEDELIKYFQNWNDFIEKKLMLPDDKFPPYYYMGFDIGDPFPSNGDFTEQIFLVCKALNTDGFVAGWYHRKNDILNELESISKTFSKYKPIVELIRFSVKGGWKTGIFDDLRRNLANWAMVVRNKKYSLLPIDFGFTTEVANEYY